MKKLFVVTAFAAFAFAAHSATACDWNREASAKDQVVATTDLTASPTCSGPNCPSPQPTSVASEETRRATAEPAPVVLITSRH
ncbi:MAG: hypothetical protein QOG08_599 [Chloroflexota bacterium]|jgi:hypothetical protein|nr:hypothetical protein [Chloroflexota bacterium]